LPTLRDLIAVKYSSRWGRGVARNQVVVTAGAVCALATAVLSLVERGDEVLIPDPGWPNYLSMVQLAGGTPVFYPLPRAEGFLPDVPAIGRLITSHTKVILVNSPANPSGAVLPRSTVRAIVELAAAHDLYVLSDEVYEDFVYEGEHVSAAEYDRDGRVIVVSGFSQSFAMTGWRLGNAIASEALASQITKMQEPLVSCASSIAQKAAEAALKMPPRVTTDMRDAYAKRRDLVVQMLRPSPRRTMQSSAASWRATTAESSTPRGTGFLPYAMGPPEPVRRGLGALSS
jgi:aspartate aminotransferase/aminotransferase